MTFILFEEIIDGFVRERKREYKYNVFLIHTTFFKIEKNLGHKF